METDNNLSGSNKCAINVSMSILSLLSLAAAVFILAITPGPGVMATVARGMASGFAPAAAVAAGIVCGDLVFLFLALFGLSAIAELLGDLFLLVRFLGGGYLILLGLGLLFKARPTRPSNTATEQGKGAPFCSGLAITLGNPKVILFYLGFLPGFLDMEQMNLTGMACTALVVGLVLGSVMLGYGYLAAHARSLFTSRNLHRKLDRTAGTMLIGTGATLLVTARS